jgi:hypothetical protein
MRHTFYVSKCVANKIKSGAELKKVAFKNKAKRLV